MRKIEISDETYSKIKDQLCEENNTVESITEMKGNKFFFRTVTYHLVGRVVGNFDNFLILEDASWVADSGRFMQAIKEGKLSEVEPVGIAYINITTVVDFFPWVHALPTEQK